MNLTAGRGSLPAAINQAIGRHNLRLQRDSLYSEYRHYRLRYGLANLNFDRELSMATKSWNVPFEDGNHVVEVNRKVFSGNLKITVDGVEVPQGKKKSWIDGSRDIPVRVGTHDCVISVKYNGLAYDYEFLPDAEPQPHTPLPKWGWIFVGLCGVMIILGGALPAGIGAGGAMMCYNTAKDENRDTATRVAICFATTVVCWGLVFGVAALLVRR